MAKEVGNSKETPTLVEIAPLLGLAEALLERVGTG